MNATERSLRRSSGWVASGAVALLVLASCSGNLVSGGPETLAKADSWDAALEQQHSGIGRPEAVLEIAYDEETAQRLWGTAVPEDLREQDAERTDGKTPGLYGSLDEVDHERQVVALWSSGQPDNCPERVSELSRSNNQFRVLTEREGAECADDDHPYRAVLVLDRDAVPEQERIEEVYALTREEGRRSGGTEVQLADFADRAQR